MTARKKQLFHQTFAATGSLSAAARAAGISQAEARMLRKSAPDQISTSQTAASRAAASLRAAVATLESEAVRRALEGVNVPVFHQGRECGSTVKHSDTLLMFLLKTLNPARYGAGATSESVAGPDHAKGRKPLTLDIDLSAAGEPWAEEDTENGMGSESGEGEGGGGGNAARQ